MRNRNIFILCITALFVLISCGEDRTKEYEELTKENQWIYNTMKDVYLWKDEIKTPERSQFFNAPSKFFTSLLNKNDKASFLTDSLSMDNYGMSVALMRDPIAENPSQVYGLVLFVEPNSPADKAGIERGTWISAVNNNKLTISSDNVLLQGDGAKLTTEYIDFDNEADKHFWVQSDTIEIGASTPYTACNICIDSIYTVRNKNIGYILCNNFDGEDFTVKANNILEKFLVKNVSDVIIDLRYNSGGKIANAAKFASMIVPANLAGTPFCTLKDKEEEIDTIYNFTEEPFNIGDRNIYFIIGEETRGAAELLVSSVKASREMFEVFTIGATSAGVNLMVEDIISPYGFSISPAIAFAYSSNGEILPEKGISPDYSFNELEQKNNIHPLGKEQEYLLYIAFYIIINGTAPATI